MAKVRFYVDVPEYKVGAPFNLMAVMNPTIKSALPGIKRIAFDVDLPPDVWKSFDEPAQASNAHVTISEDEDHDHP